MTPKALSDIRRKLRILNYAKEIRHVSKACRYYGSEPAIFIRTNKSEQISLKNYYLCPKQ